MISRSILLSLLLVPALEAQEPAPPPPATAAPTAEAPSRDITVEFRCIGLSRDLAVPLIRHFRSGRGEERAQAEAELDAMLRKGTAKLLAWPLLTTHAGQRATYDDTEEVRYATQFEPATSSVFMSDHDGKLTRQPTELQSHDFEPMATNFESQRMGVTLEIQPELAGDGKSINLQAHAEHARLKSVDRITTEHERVTEKRVEKVTQEQPRFTTMKVTTQIFLQSGETQVLGIFNAPDDPDRVEVFLVAATLLGAP